MTGFHEAESAIEQMKTCVDDKTYKQKEEEHPDRLHQEGRQSNVHAIDIHACDGHKSECDQEEWDGE